MKSLIPLLVVGAFVQYANAAGTETNYYVNSMPDPAVFHTPASLQAGDTYMSGSQQPESQPPSSIPRRGRHEGCEYWGKLGGGWICR